MNPPTYTLLAESFRYPVPGRLEELERGLKSIQGDARKGYAAFVKGIQKLSLTEWEELYTITWDLNPVAAPYIGYQMWGENYQRGNFMSNLNRELLNAGIDCDGELPDHLIPVLRYLAAAPEPLPELLEIWPTALERISAALKKADAGNPYLHLLTLLSSVSSERRSAAH
jgi:nitrate reductase delta subunit